ncbi:TonB family protein, partial [Vannielia litorea]|uniref:TonB family protein n=1 Tax=Vannielia litorea TaxID=1217970 RepID=UPI001BCF1295
PEQAPQATEIDTANAEPLKPQTAPTRSIRPRKMPKRPEPQVAETRQPKPQPQRTTQAKPAERSSHARAGATSAGAGGSSQAGIATRSGARALTASQKQSLMNKWKAQVYSHIARRTRSPGGRGTVVLRVTVTTSGQVTGLAMVRSSGNKRLDQAAVRIVRGAGRMPRAPKQLGATTVGFNVPFDFE